MICLILFLLIIHNNVKIVLVFVKSNVGLYVVVVVMVFIVKCLNCSTSTKRRWVSKITQGRINIEITLIFWFTGVRCDKWYSSKKFFLDFFQFILGCIEFDAWDSWLWTATILNRNNSCSDIWIWNISSYLDTFLYWRKKSCIHWFYQFRCEMVIMRWYKLSLEAIGINVIRNRINKIKRVCLYLKKTPGGFSTQFLFCIHVSWW